MCRLKSPHQKNEEIDSLLSLYNFQLLPFNFLAFTF